MNDIKTTPVEVSDIFRVFGEQFRLQYKMPLHHRNTMLDIEHCRTAVMGSRVDVCDSCGHVRSTYNSCSNRHCPKCQGLKKELWVEKLSVSLLPVRYFHIVFTIPSELNRLTLVNQERMYNILFSAASQTILSLAKEKKHLGVATGLIAILHTWGQNLMDHPHLHTLVPAGGLDTMHSYWKNSSKKFFIHVKVLSQVFKGKFLALLKEAYNNGELKFEGSLRSLILKKNFKQLLDEVYQKPWVVYSKSSFKNSSQIINYLGRYSHRIAISNSRIIGIDNNQVLFKWKDYADGNRYKTMRLQGVEFIRRFMLHVLPKGFCKIRYFGIFASRNKKTLLSLCFKAMPHKIVKSKIIGLNWQEQLAIITGMELWVCPVCKTGKMIFYERIKYIAPP